MKGPKRVLKGFPGPCLTVCPPSAASQLKSEELSLPEGKVRVKLDHDGAILDVDEDDVEKVCRRLVAGTGGGLSRAGLSPGSADRFCIFSACLPVLSHRPMLPHAIVWKIWPHWCTSTSPASCTHCASAMVLVCCTRTLAPASSSSAPVGPLLCTQRRYSAP